MPRISVWTGGFESFEGVRSEHALPVWSERLGLIGKCDIVEFYPDGRIYPVEYKHGKNVRKPMTIYNWQRRQSAWKK